MTANGFESRPGGAVPLGVVAAFLAQHNTDMVGHDLREPVSTIVGRGSTQALVAPLLIPRYGEREGQAPRASSVAQPMPTVVPTGNGASLVAAFLAKYYGTGDGAAIDEPMHTVTTRDRSVS